jgi:hypothetical protein
VIIATSQALNEAERRRLSNHAAAILSKKEIGSDEGTEIIRRGVESAGVALRA